MISDKRYFFMIVVTCLFTAGVFAQSTTNSPYSKFGVGNLKGSYLPQFRAMGNIAYGISSVGAYQNINISNPASYSKINLTTFDVGAIVNTQNLSKGTINESAFNAALNHFTLAVPVTKKSAFSIGLLPYSNLGYQSQEVTRVDTFNVNQIYSGQGGLSKAYLGYGFAIGKHLNLGANLNYIFGDLKQTRASEYDYSNVGFLNTKSDNDLSVGGLNFDLGLQYITKVNDRTQLTIGYTGGIQSTMNTNSQTLYTRYQKDFASDTEFRSDTISFVDGVKGKLILPANHNLGFSFERANHWLFGADVRVANWSDYSRTGSNERLNNTFGISVGGQYIPNYKAVTNYLKLMEYRAGFNYDKTYLNVNGSDIKLQSLNLGFGFPLVSSRSAFYKINFTTELGQRGTLENNLVKERFMNFYLGFTINDKWFQKYKYD